MPRLKLYQSEVWLRSEYVSKGKTATQIANEQGVAVKTIDRYLDKFGLKLNPRSWQL